MTFHSAKTSSCGLRALATVIGGAAEIHAGEHIPALDQGLAVNA
jgi:hypothetical protein